MDLVDEQHVAVFEIGEQRREVAFGDHRAGGGAEIDAQFARDDLRQRGLAQPRRPDEQHMIERFLARPRRLDEHRKVRARLLLADELGEPLRAQRGFRAVFVAALRRHGRRRGRECSSTACALLAVTCSAKLADRRDRPAGGLLATICAHCGRSPRSARGSCRTATPPRWSDRSRRAWDGAPPRWFSISTRRHR